VPAPRQGKGHLPLLVKKNMLLLLLLKKLVLPACVCGGRRGGVSCFCSTRRGGIIPRINQRHLPLTFHYPQLIPRNLIAPTPPSHSHQQVPGGGMGRAGVGAPRRRTTEARL
jgi:hypothetical protein